MLVLAYGKSRRFWRESLLFLALTCAFGGFVLAAQWMGGKGLMVQRGVYYAGGNSKLLFLTAALGAAAVGLIYRGILRHSGLDRELTAVRLELGERRVELTALVDNGNTLTDPVSGQSVVVAEGERLRSLFPPENCPEAAELRDPASAMERLGAGEWKRRFCLLPYRAVGVERGLLLAVRVDRLWAAGEDMGSRLVALSPTPVSDGGGYQALMGN
jgi:stage II sporulation protein GA (sporulation sigma-E factor processing peptidase)